MKVRLNDDPEIVKTIREGLKRTGGYCPCRLARTEENKCMCKEFKDQIADPELRGLLPLPAVLQGEIKKSGRLTRFFYFFTSSLKRPSTVSTTPPMSMKSARFHTSARFFTRRWGNCR